MAFSGDVCTEDIQKKSLIRFETEIQFTNEGLVTEISEDLTNHRLSDVIQVVNGDIDCVLPFIGLRRMDFKDLIEDNVLEIKDDMTESIKKLGHRSPGSHLLVHNNRIYGVIVDHNNDCRVVGRITSVVPEKESSEGLNVVIVGKEGVRKTCRSIDCDLKTLVNNGNIFSIISENGFAFVETNDCLNEDIPSLVLVLNKAYILFEDLSIDWIRLKIGLKINQFVAKKTKITPKECIVSLRAGYTRDGDGLVLYGSQNSVLDFDSFQAFMQTMSTIGLQSGQHFNEDSDYSNEKQNDSGIVSELPILSSESEENQKLMTESQEIREESSDSIDSYYDNISPDSFS